MTPLEFMLGKVYVLLPVAFSLSALSLPHLCPRLFHVFRFLVMKPWGSCRDGGLTAPILPICSRRLWAGRGSDRFGEEYQTGLVGSRRLSSQRKQLVLCGQFSL